MGFLQQQLLMVFNFNWIIVIFYLIGIFSYKNLQMKGKLSSQKILAIKLEMFSSITNQELYKQYPNERIDYDSAQYYYYIPLIFSKTCQPGQYYDSNQ